MTQMRSPGADPRKDVRQAIEKIFPHHVVEMGFDSEESYFWEVYPKLGAAIRRLKGVWLVSEREAKGRPVWFNESDPDEDLADNYERDRSYHLFFVCPQGEAFTYETELESLLEPDEEAEAEDQYPGTVPGNGRTGWSVAVSLLAPFAVITLSHEESYEDDSFSEPSIEPPITDRGERIDPDAEFRQSKGESAYEVLVGLRGRISRILERNGIGVLPEEEWRRPVPWLRAGDEVVGVTNGEPVRVLDVFFFEGL